MKRLLYLGLLLLATVQARAQNIFPYTPTGWDGPVVVSAVSGTNTSNTGLKAGYQLYLDYALRHDFSSDLASLKVEIQVNDRLYRNSFFTDLSADPTFGNGLDIILILPAGTHEIKVIIDPDDEIAESDETDNISTLSVTVTDENTFNPADRTELAELEYFIDTDPGTGSGTSLSLSGDDFDHQEMLDISLATTSPGFHQLYFRAKNTDHWGPTQVLNFINLQASDSTVTGIEYFVDTDPGLGNGTFIASDDPSLQGTLNFTVPLTDVSVGFHQLYTRAKSDNGTWSQTEATSFFNLVAAFSDLAHIEYFIDDDPGLGSGIPVTFTSGQETINFNVDLSDLNTGFHQLHVRARSESGTWSLLESSGFLVEKGTGRRADVERIEYFYTDGTSFSEVFTYTFPEAAQTIDAVAPLDISFLQSGESYVLVVRAVDASGAKSLRRTETFTFIENTAPEISDQSFQTDENPDNGAVIGQVVASDVDGDAVTFSIASGNDSGAFTLSEEGELSVLDSTLFNFESTNSYTLQVAASDSKESSEAAITVNITDVNDVPIVVDQSLSVEENATNGSVIGQIVASDEDGQELAFSILSGNDEGTFGLSATGELSVLDSTLLDFESVTSFDVEISVSDGAASTEATITINITDRNDLPVMANQVFSLDENTTEATVIGQLDASDADGDDLTFELLSGNSDDAFALSTSGELSVQTSAALDFETQPSFSLQVQVSDGDGATDEATITVNLNDVDESTNSAPVFEDATFNIDENASAGTIVAQLEASDADGDDMTYELISGNTDDAFALSASGELTVLTTATLDFETQPSFSLQVQVSDGDSATDEATITVNLNDVDESTNSAPVFEDATFNIDENASAGTIVAQLEASDADGDDMTYELISGNTDDAFALSASGELTVLTTATLDFETQPSFSLQVQVSDGDSATDEATITVNLNDIDESTNSAPEVSDQSFEIAENSTNGKLVGTVAANDPENDALSFSLIAGNEAGVFSMDETTGDLAVANSDLLDYEVQVSYSLTVAVSDGNLSSEAMLSIAVTDVDEAVLSISDPLSQIKVYPNPVSNVLTIKGSDIREISLFSLGGEKLIQTKDVTISVAHLKTGIYLLELKTAKGTIFHTRVLKQ